MKSKVYHYDKEEEDEDGEVTHSHVVKQKGMPVKSTGQDFSDVLFKPNTTIKAQYQEIAKKDCVLYTRQVTKQALNAVSTSMSKLNMIFLLQFVYFFQLNDKQLMKNCRIHSEPYGYVNFTPECQICDPAQIALFEESAKEINQACEAMEVEDAPVDEVTEPAEESRLQDYDDPMEELDLRPVDVVMAEVHNEDAMEVEFEL